MKMYSKRHGSPATSAGNLGLSTSTMLVVAAIAGCGVPLETPAAGTTQGVQSSYADAAVGTPDAAVRAYDILLADSAQLQTRATAASHSYNFGSGFWSTCGMTFVSPHYAITAGHCTTWWFDTNSTMQLEQFDTTAVTPAVLAAKEQVTGATFANFAHPAFSASEGYKTSKYLCDVVANCNYATGHCPTNVATAIANSMSPPDVAIIRCAARPATAAWVSAAQPSLLNGGYAEVRWFHEVLNMPTTESTDDRWTHYGATFTDVPSIQSSWHRNTYHDLMPLRSSSVTYGGTKYFYRTAGLVTASGYRRLQTDIPSCQGMSGSGLFPNSQSGTEGTSAYVMGIASSAGGSISINDSAGRTRLCAAMDQWRPGTTPQVNSTFIQPAVVEELGKVDFIVADRQ